MARKHEAVQLLKSGLSPAQVAKRMDISLSTVRGYLLNQVGEGALNRSDILFSIAPEVRSAVEEVVAGFEKAPRWSQVEHRLYRHYSEVDRGEAELYFSLRHPHVYLGDMYFTIYVLEVVMHRYIKLTLKDGYGDEWWRTGIPASIRAECAAALENDPEPAAEPYCYTTLIHLKDIFQKRWDLFSKLLPPGPASNRQRFLSDLTRLNQIRNRVMHPAKAVVPGEEDFRFVKEFMVFVELDKWVEQQPAAADLCQAI